MDETKSHRILVIEDEPHTRKALCSMLVQDGYVALEATTGSEGVAQCISSPPEVVLLDLGLPDVDGNDVTRQIRDFSDVPIIVVSARSRESDQIAALDQGANDYVTKPFRDGELLARIRVAIRSLSRPKELSEPFSVGDLRVDPGQRRVFVGDTEVNLTPTEYKLLLAMVRQAGKVVTHEQLLREVWGPGYLREVQYVRVYMKQLRYKLEKEPAQPKYLLTVPGVGYRLRVED
jgi:two-component system KDP operon response regulator KdpE